MTIRKVMNEYLESFRGTVRSTRPLRGGVDSLKTAHLESQRFETYSQLSKRQGTGKTATSPTQIQTPLCAGITLTLDFSVYRRITTCTM